MLDNFLLLVHPLSFSLSYSPPSPPLYLLFSLSLLLLSLLSFPLPSPRFSYSQLTNLRYLSLEHNPLDISDLPRDLLTLPNLSIFVESDKTHKISTNLFIGSQTSGMVMNDRQMGHVVFCHNHTLRSHTNTKGFFFAELSFSYSYLSLTFFSLHTERDKSFLQSNNITHILSLSGMDPSHPEVSETRGERAGRERRGNLRGGGERKEKRREENRADGRTCRRFLISSPFFTRNLNILFWKSLTWRTS